MLQEAALARGKRGHGRLLRSEQVAIEARRPAHGLARVVEDEVEPRERAAEVAGEGLDAGCVAQIEAVHLQAVTPVSEVGLACVASRRVARETRGHDQLRARAQEHDAGLVADLDARSGDQRDATGKVCRLRTLGEVEVTAAAAHRVVEEVQLAIVSLADVAGARLAQHARRLRSELAIDVGAGTGTHRRRETLLRSREDELAALLSSRLSAALSYAQRF